VKELNYLYDKNKDSFIKGIWKRIFRN